MLVVDCYTVTMDQSDSSIRWLLSVRIGQAHFVMCIHLTMQHYVMSTSCALGLLYFSIVCLCVCVHVYVCVCLFGASLWCRGNVLSSSQMFFSMPVSKCVPDGLHSHRL